MPAMPRRDIRVCYASGDRAAVIAEYRRVIQANPTWPRTHEPGAALAEDGNLDGAIAELRATLPLEPTNDEAARNLQLALEMKPRWFYSFNLTPAPSLPSIPKS